MGDIFDELFGKLSWACKYREPGMPVYDEPPDECLYYGRAGAAMCSIDRCPLLNEKKEE
jgi:hypothetical protein